MYYHNLKEHKSVGFDEIDPQNQRELADEVAKPLSIVFERSWSLVNLGKGET